MQLLLCDIDCILTLPSNVYFILSSSVGTWWGVAVNAGKWRWEIDGSIGDGLDQPDVLACASTDDGMQGQLEFHDVDLSIQLQARSAQAVGGLICLSDTYNLINHDQDSCFRMLRALGIAENCNP